MTINPTQLAHEAVDAFKAHADNSVIMRKVDTFKVNADVTDKVTKAAENAVAYATRKGSTTTEIAEAGTKAAEKAFRAQLTEGFAKQGHMGASIANLFNKTGGAIKSTFNIGGASEFTKPGVLSKGASGIVNFTSNRIAKNPKLAVLGLVAGTAALGNHLIKGHAQKRTVEAAQADLAAAQGPQVNNYTVTPAEYAAMEARMRAGNAGKGHADAVLAARQQQTAETTAAL